VAVRKLGLVPLALLALLGTALEGGCGRGALVEPPRVEVQTVAPRKVVAETETETACARDVGELRTWLGVLLEEGEVNAEIIPDPADDHHYLDRPMPLVTLAPSEEPPAPRPVVAILTLSSGKLAHDDLVEEVRHVHAPGKVVKRVSGSILSPMFSGGGVGRMWVSHPVLLFVGERERWSDVVAVVDAVTKAGFTTVHFPLAAASRASAPSFESPVAKRILAQAMDAMTMPWKRDVAIAEEMARANPECPGVASAFEKVAGGSIEMDAQRADFAQHAADAFSRCSCRGDLSAIRAFAWARFGRHWGPTSVTHAVEVGPPPEPGEQVEVVSGPKNATWREMSRRVVEVSRTDAGAETTKVRFVATP